jgi:hypothetical protein
VRLQVHTARCITRLVLREVISLTGHDRLFNSSWVAVAVAPAAALEEDEEGDSSADESDHDGESDSGFGGRGEVRQG